MAVGGIFSRLVLSRDRTWLHLLRKTVAGGCRFYTADGKSDGDSGGGGDASGGGGGKGVGRGGKVENSSPTSSPSPLLGSELPGTAVVAATPQSFASASTSSSSPQYVSGRRQRRQEKVLDESERKAMLERGKYFLDFVNDSSNNNNKITMSTTTTTTAATNKATTQEPGRPDSDNGPGPSSVNSGKMDGTLKEFLEADSNVTPKILGSSTTDGGDPPDVDGQVDFPSDSQEYVNWSQKKGRFAVRPPVDPEMTTVLLFPGQGSQFVGMGGKLVNGHQRCREMYDVASSILGYDLLKLCLEGPKSELDRTVVCQPAVMVTSLAAVEWMQDENPEAIKRCIATAGFSVGEISALVFAGVLDFEEAVKLIKVRAEGMQAASEETPSGMLTVFCTHKTKLGLAMQVAREVCQQKYKIEEPVCQIANYLYPECKVIAGHDMALNFIENNTRDFGIRRTKRLPVSGAFHTPIMAPCVPSFADALKKVVIKDPVFPVYSNVKAKHYIKTSKGIKKVLRKQITAAVRWEQILHTLYARDKEGAKFPHTYEVGPGKQLGTFLRMVNLKAYVNYHNVEV